MATIVWDEVGKRFYETGIDRGVLYPSTGEGVPWNGLVSVTESVLGGETESYYNDGIKFLDFIANADFKATLEAFSSPPEFALCEGSKALALGLFATQQPRVAFGLSYCTRLGNDVAGTDYGYKLHLVYDATASPSDSSSKSLSNSTDPGTKSWEINCVPPASSTYRPTAHFVINSTIADPTKLAAVEAVLYGATDLPALPTQSALIALLT